MAAMKIRLDPQLLRSTENCAPPLEYVDLKARGTMHLDAKQMGDDVGPKMLYGNMGMS
jgi:hypothetical protein